VADLPGHSAVAWHGALNERLCEIDDFRCGDIVLVRSSWVSILHTLGEGEEAFGSCKPQVGS
jgi:hypothetical protein